MSNGFNAVDAADATIEILTESIVDTDLGITGQKQHVALQDGTVGSHNKLIVDAAGAAKVDGSAVTQPVSAAALPLPTGAATAAKQPALGTAGTPSADVISVQGVTSGTPLSVDSELTTADLDTGAGTDTRAVVGIARAESGGATLVGSANPLPVSGPVTVVDGGDVAQGATTDVETASGNGSIVSILKRLRTLLNGGLPAALGGLGGLKVEVISGIAAARTTDSISSALATDALMNGLTVLTPTPAGITASASGATTVVAAVASKKIRVLAAFIVCNAAVSVNFQSHTTTATKTGVMPFATNGGIVLPFNPVGWFDTVAGEALDINLGGAVAVGGGLVYVEV